MYYYNCEDDDPKIMLGYMNGIEFGDVIQPDDGYGGYNVSFNVPNNICVYHVHFFIRNRQPTLQVNIVRFKEDASLEGTNIIKYNGRDIAKTFSGLYRECEDEYPNHKGLLLNFRNAAVALQIT